MFHVEHIRQKGRSDCGIAAIAMFVGSTYDDVLTATKKCSEYHPRKGMSCCARILELLGFHWENLGRHEDHPAPNPGARPFRSMSFNWTPIKPSFIAQFYWGRPALLSIVSLNHPPNGRHLVFYDGARVFDPQEGRRGKKFVSRIEDVEICEAWIWGQQC